MAARAASPPTTDAMPMPALAPTVRPECRLWLVTGGNWELLGVSVTAAEVEMNEDDDAFDVEAVESGINDAIRFSGGVPSKL